MTFVDSTPVLGTTYLYRVAAVNVAGPSRSAPLPVAVSLPVAPTGVVGTAVRQGAGERVTLPWADLVNESGYTIQWSTSSTFATVAGTGSAASNATSFTTGTIARQAWFFRLRGNNGLGAGEWSQPVQVPAAP